MNTLSSNAYNFSEYFSSGVDPRTGMFTMSLSLGDFLSHKTSGDSIPLSIGYSPMNSNDSGFGKGWGMSISFFDSVNLNLSLSTGQAFKVQWNDDIKEYEMPYRGIKDIRVFYDESNNEMIVVYKDGRKEFLCLENGYTKRTTSINGLTIYYDYEIYRGEMTLWRIYDNAGRELEIDWRSNKYLTTVIHKLNDKTFSSFLFYRRGYDFELEYFQLKGCDEYVHFQYKIFNPSGYKLIAKITHPTGMMEELEYKNTHYLPKGAPIEVVPAVSRHIRTISADRPQQITSYEYSARNFLGFDSDRKWLPGEDNLFKATIDYKYSSKEIINNKMAIMRVYNKYHLLCDEYYYDDSFLYRKIELDYFADLDLPIEHQPPQYSFLKSKKTIFIDDNTGRKRELLLEYDYDIYGNKTYERNPDGTACRIDYYAAAGEGDKCPPSPTGMVTFKKSETILPNDARFRARSTYSEYKKININSHDYFVVLSKQHYLDSGTTHEYFENVEDSLSFGRIKKSTEQLNNLLVCTLEKSYHIIDDTKLKESTKVTTFDNLVLEKNETYSLDLYKLLVMHDISEDMKVEISYDFLGREISTVHNKGRRYEKTTSKQYFTSPNRLEIVETDANGNQSIISFDSAGNPISTHIKPKSDSQSYLSEKIEYDQFGFASKHIEYDWYESNKILETATKYKYDRNGNISEANHPDGRVEYITQNPVTLTTVHLQPKLLRDITYFNVASQVIKKETFDANDKLVAKTEYQYDGYGNQTKIIDAKGNIIDFEYDDYDRVAKVTRYINGEAIIESYGFAPRTTLNHVNRVFLDGFLIGERTFDGLLRIIEENSQGVIKEHSYEGISARIQRTTIPADFTGNKYVISMTYDQDNKRITSLITNPDQKLNKTFHYDNSDNLVETLNSSSKQTWKYDDFNRIIEESVELNNGKTCAAKLKISLKNKVMEQTDFDGNIKKYTYDKFGRLFRRDEIPWGGKNQFAAYYSYDPFSRMDRIDLDTNNKRYSFVLKYNALSLETSRTFIEGLDNYIFTLKQVYDKNSLVTERVYTEGKNITTETYSYDSYNRLIEYICQGENQPKDEYGNKIKQQKFQHDKYSNITQVETMFTDSTNNIQSFIYAENYPTKLGRIKNTHPNYPQKMDCLYDANGNLVNDSTGKMYAHNVLGQVDTVYSDKNGKNQLTSYQYDASGRMVSQKMTDKSLVYFYYLNNKLHHEASGNVVSTVQNLSKGFENKIIKKGGEIAKEYILMGDANGSILMADSYVNKIKESLGYTYLPYGVNSKEKIDR